MSKFNFFWRSKARQVSDTVLDEKVIASLLVMAWVVEARDPYTGGHLWRVSRFSRLLSDHAGIQESEAERIAIGGFLHDLGKVAIPDAILCKPDKLTNEEYEIIKTHPEAGRRLLAGHPFSDLVMDAVFMHHETPDGRGYPRGLKHADIPLSARIVGICDAFDAMTSVRPYRRGMPIEKALGIIRENMGRQFDAELGEHFIALGDSHELQHIVGHSDDGIPLQECLMCGPTLVTDRGAKAGDRIYCRACTDEYRIEGDGARIHAVPTGHRGTASDLTPKADTALIAKLVAESAHIFSTNRVSALPF